MIRRLAPLSLMALALGCAGTEDRTYAQARSAVTVSPRFDISPLQREGGSTLTAPLVVDLPTSSLVFQAPRIGQTGVGEVLVRARDATGAYVNGSLRALPATFGTIIGVAPIRAASYGAGAMVAGVDASLRVIAARVDATGAPIDRAPLVAYTSSLRGAYDLMGLACVTAANTCLVAYPFDASTVAATRIATDGRVLDATPIELGTNIFATATSESMVALSDRFIVGWPVHFPGATNDLRFARVMPDGRTLDPGGRVVSIAGGVRSDLSLATDGSRVFATWSATASGSRPTGIYTQIFDRDLNALSTLAVHTDLSGLYHPGWDGTGWYLTNEHVVVRFDSAGTRLDTTPRAIVGPGTQYWAGAAAGGFYLYTPTPFAVSRYTSAGAALQTGALPIGYAGVTGLGLLDADGATFVAGWAMSSAWSLTRINLSGALLDAPPFTLSSPVYPYGALALEGTTAHLISAEPSGAYPPPVLHDQVDLATRTAAPSATVSPPNANGLEIVRGAGQRIVLMGDRLLRFSATWAPLDAGPISYTTEQARFAGDFDGTNYMLVSSSAYTASTYARRMNLSGDFVDAAPHVLATGSQMASMPRVAWGAGAHLVVWVDIDGQVRTARLASDGTPGTPQTIGTSIAPPGTATDIVPPRLVDVRFDGANFVVAWLDRAAAQLRAARVSPAGAVLDATPFYVSAGEYVTPYVQKQSLALASDGNGSTLIEYLAFDTEFAAPRLRGVFFREEVSPVTDAGVASDVPRDVVVDAGATDVTVVTDVPRDVVDAGATDVTVVTDAPRDVVVDAGATDVTVVTDVPRDVVVDAGATDVTVVTDAPRDVVVDAGATDVTVVADLPVVVDVPRDVSADAGPGDVTTTDASSADATGTDAPSDAAPIDATAPDASEDATAPDASEDATAPDASVTDTVTPDTGVTDASASDASATDVGERDTGVSDVMAADASAPPSGGSSCDVRIVRPQSDSGGVIFAAVALAGFSRARRRNRR